MTVPDFMTFAEDLSYNHGPMLSGKQFDEFIASYYKEILPILSSKGIVPFVDTDGNVSEPMEWFLGIGVEGFLPLERMAGVDIAALRQKHPSVKMIGAFDKTVMHLGEDAMRAEFDRLLPVMRQGGFIPSVDHQTPPDVSLDNYKICVKLLKQYCKMACEDLCPRKTGGGPVHTKTDAEWV
jgi:uroporphyrinogen-III decarboxylase